MIKNLIRGLIIILMISACNQDSVTVDLPDGTYKGIFGRSSPNAKYMSAEVEITFDNQQFQGSSSMINYPAICNGTYKISGTKIEFIESCIWTADFDWSFILSGKFDISIEGDELNISRSYDEEVIDSYRLKRE